MTKSEKQRWERERAKGFTRYLLREGLLKYGLGFGILMMLARVFINHDSIAPISAFLIRFAFYVLAFGAVMGAVTWRMNEKDFQKPTEDDDAAKPESK